MNHGDLRTVAAQSSPNLSLSFCSVRYAFLEIHIPSDYTISGRAVLIQVRLRRFQILTV